MKENNQQKTKTNLLRQHAWSFLLANACNPVIMLTSPF